MSKLSDLRQETDHKVLSWFKSIETGVCPWVEPGTQGYKGLRPLYFDIDFLTDRQFIAVPFIDFWAPCSELIVDGSDFYQSDRMFGRGLEHKKEQVLSVTMNRESVSALILEFLSNCLVVPRDSNFSIIHTSLDYWILAGPFDLVNRACKWSIPDTIKEFEAAVRDLDDVFEAGPPFCDFLSEMYLAHNKTIIDKGRA